VAARSSQRISGCQHLPAVQAATDNFQQADGALDFLRTQRETHGLRPWLSVKKSKRAGWPNTA